MEVPPTSFFPFIFLILNIGSKYLSLYHANTQK